MGESVRVGEAEILVGDVVDGLRRIPDGTVQCCVTSPPYWGLRDYGTGQWEGGDPECKHSAGGQVQDNKAPGAITAGVRPGCDANMCRKCGARRIDKQLGLERVTDCLGWATKQPCGACYICRMVSVFREVRRTMRDDAVCFVNMGDTYAAKRGYQVRDNKHVDVGNDMAADVPAGLKPKDLCGVPWRLALALQADGWWLRSDCPWLKRNAMPESCKDRPATAVEHIFLLTKSARYHYDNEAVKVEAAADSYERYEYGFTTDAGKTGNPENDSAGACKATRQKDGQERFRDLAGRNRRNSDWFFESWQGLYSEGDEPLAFIVNPSAYKGAHFATFSPKLVEPCILAGTSPQACPVCGKAWERVVGVTRKNPISREDRQVATGGAITGGVGKNFPDTTVKTLGFAPACRCEGNDGSGRCLVLDPFLGSGTTLAVALRLGCRGVGCELNPEYVELAKERIGKETEQGRMF